MLRGQWLANYRRAQRERCAASGSYATSGGFGNAQFPNPNPSAAPAPGPAPSGDALWDSVILRVTFDEDATDVSPRARTLAASGTPVLDAAAAQFGPAGLVTTTGSYSYTVETPADDFGSGDFCMEAWVYNTEAQPNGAKIFDDADGAVYVDLLDFLDTGTYVRAAIWQAGFSGLVQLDSRGIDDTYRMSDNEKHHIVLNRVGGRVNLFVDGVLRGTSDFGTADAAVHYSGQRSIGASPGGGGRLTGGIDDVRITKGHSRYGNDNFTPPTAALPVAGE